MVSPSQRIAGVGHLVNHRICSERKACQTLQACRSHYRKKEKKHPDKEEQAILEASSEKPTWGIRKIASFLRARHAMPINHKRVERIRRENNLQACTKRKANRRTKMPVPVREHKQASAIDKIWSCDLKQNTGWKKSPYPSHLRREYIHKCLLLHSVRSLP